MASVATMTGTLIDSGCKHIIPVRVSMDTLLTLAAEPDQNILLRDKMRFCCHKNDLVLCVNKPIFPEGRGSLAKNAAYPNVITTLGDIPDELKLAIALFYHTPEVFVGPNGSFQLQALVGSCRESVPEAPQIGPHFEKATIDGFKDGGVVVSRMKKLPQFSFMGFSLGLGYAHPSSGDTVVSAMIGGMISVQNGHYHVCTGDQIMWYFEFEEVFFDRDGRRIRDAKGGVLGPAERARRGAHRRENGHYEGTNERNTGKTNIAYPKPYLPPALEKLGGLDRARIFAKAVSNARPFDKLDLLICTQSI